MALLDLSQYIGGADNIQVEITFPSSQKTILYNFQQDITNWEFFLDYQTVVANSITYDRNTGAPNFASSQLIGTFPSGVIDTSTYITLLDPAAGTVAVTIPANIYTGPIIPDARTHTPLTIVGFTWTTNDVPAQIATHRWAYLMSWEPGVIPGDPTLTENYTSVVVGV
jgi:hypothetical protein